MPAEKHSPGPFTFSTDDLPERDRIAIWREVVGRVHLHLDAEPLGEQPLRVTINSCRWPSASIFFGETTSARAARTPELLQDGDCSFRVLHTLGGKYRFRGRNFDEVISAGSPALLFNGVESEVSYPSRCRVTAVRFDRAVLSAALPGLDSRAIQRLPLGSPATRLFMQYVNILCAEGSVIEEGLARHASEHLADLVVLALGATGDAAEVACGRGMPAARLAAIKSDVVSELGNYNLSTAMMAKRHGISARYIRMLFEHDGTTFSEFVLASRLDRAHRMLNDRRLAGQTIATIAFECGFSDLSYFYRTFRRAYDATPSDIRHERQGC